MISFQREQSHVQSKCNKDLVYVDSCTASFTSLGVKPS